MPRVTTFPTMYGKAWPRHDDGEPGTVVDLGEALEADYVTDARFAAYASPNGRRLCREAIDALDGIELNAIVFDVDGPEHQAPESWRVEMRSRVRALASAHPDPYFYETRHGCRIVYALTEPTILRSQDDAAEWSRAYVIAASYLARRFGIDADEACADWQRLYRLPNVVREGNDRPENYPRWGNPDQIGSLLVPADHADLETARARQPKRFARRKITRIAPCSTSGDGLLFKMLEARGDIVREVGRGVWAIRCPNESNHTTGQTGDGSTFLYGPCFGKELGAIHCKHTHCEHLSVRDWIEMFSDAERECARGAA